MSISIVDYLIDKLSSVGCKHIFGLPGDYILQFFKITQESKKCKLIITCDEQGSGFAADSYARLAGFGCVMVTYGAGALKVVNSCAQAYAELSPVLVISGAPSSSDRNQNNLVHHRVKHIETQYKIFEQVTCCQALLSESNAFSEIDRVINTILLESKPGYIEIPLDLQEKNLDFNPKSITSIPMKEDPTSEEYINSFFKNLSEVAKKGEKGVVVLGLEVHRFKLQEQVLNFLEKYNLPFVNLIQSKGTLSETHPNYLGLYAGVMSNPTIAEYVESCDFVILLGVIFDDMDLGHFTAKLPKNKCIFIQNKGASISGQSFHDMSLKVFLDSTQKTPSIFQMEVPRNSWPKKPTTKFTKNETKALTMDTFFTGLLSNVLPENSVLIGDIGTALFGAAEVELPSSSEFIGSPYYACMGFAVPAALGAQLARPDKKIVCLVGDGAFQMTGIELSTILRYKLNCTVVILNNDGYTTERIIKEGLFDDIQPWNYTQITKLIGGGSSYKVSTEKEALATLEQSLGRYDSLTVVEATFERSDLPPTQRRQVDHERK